MYFFISCISFSKRQTEEGEEEMEIDRNEWQESFISGHFCCAKETLTVLTKVRIFAYLSFGRFMYPCLLPTLLSNEANGTFHDGSGDSVRDYCV